MCAYNRLNGEYCSEHNWLLNEVLRDEWGFDGAVVTDWGATNDRVLGVQSGLDLEMPSSGGINDKLVLKAVHSGELTQADLDAAVLRNLCISLAGAQLPERNPNIDLAAHHQLARRAAVESCVLLKNTSALLCSRINSPRPGMCKSTHSNFTRKLALDHSQTKLI